MNENNATLLLLPFVVGWTSGMGLFKTLVTLVLISQYLLVSGFPGFISVTQNVGLFATIGVLALIEVVLDFKSGWDVKWDRWNGLLRLAGAGALVVLLQPEGVGFNLAVSVSAAVLLALLSHCARSGARLAAWRIETGIFIAPIAAVTEICMIGTLLLPLVIKPVLSGMMLGFLILAAFLIAYLVRREFVEALRGIFTPWKLPLHGRE